MQDDNLYHFLSKEKDIKNISKINIMCALYHTICTLLLP